MWIHTVRTPAYQAVVLGLPSFMPQFLFQVLQEFQTGSLYTTIDTINFLKLVANIQRQEDNGKTQISG
jgi:hypothetical protein